MQDAVGHRLIRELRRQWWDDHRYYHHSRINQSLHVVSACVFILAYVWLFISPPVAAWLAWCVSMLTRQAGHFFFEPRGYDTVNQASDAHKEAIKVGYNIQRKIVLMAAWAAAPVVLWAWPQLGAWSNPHGSGAWWADVGWAWLWLGVAGLGIRALVLLVTQGPQVALVWVVKILSDPFHDLWQYRGAPWALWRGERLDTMHAVRSVAR